VDSGGDGAAAGGENDDVVLDQFLDDRDMLFIMLGPGVVAADHAGDTANPAIDDVVVEGIVTAPEGSAEMVLDRFDTETGDLGGFMPRNHDLGATVLEIRDSHLDDPDGILHRIMLIELDMDNIFLFHLGDGVSGDEFGVEAFGDIGQILENTLDIDDHRITGAGDDRQFLLQEGPCRRDDRDAVTVRWRYSRYR